MVVSPGQMQTAVAAVSGIISYLLMLRFHSIPADVQAAVPAVVAVALGYLAHLVGVKVQKVQAAKNKTT